MSDRPIGDALSKPIVIPDVPKDAVTVAVEKTSDDLGASIVAHKDFGKPGGWEGGASGGWWKSTGLRVIGWLTWKK